MPRTRPPYPPEFRAQISANHAAFPVAVMCRALVGSSCARRAYGAGPHPARVPPNVALQATRTRGRGCAASYSITRWLRLTPTACA